MRSYVLLIIVLFLSVPSSPPQAVQGVAVDSRTISLSWDPPSLDEHNGIIREYLVNITEVDTGRTFERSSTVESLVVTSLHPYYSYSFTIAAITVGLGPFSEAVVVQTPQDSKRVPII